MSTRTLSPRGAAARWRDRLAAEDPGGFSGRNAIRAILALVVTGWLLMALGAGATAALLGASMAMTAAVSVFDPDPAAQAVTMALGILAAIAATSLAALVSTSVWTSSVLLCVIVFVAGVARARGPRWFAVGMIAFMGYFFALFVVARPEQIPLLAASLAGGGVIAFVVRFAVVRDRPARVHESVLRAFRARLRLLLDDVADELESGKLRERELRVIRRQTGRLNEAALALEQAVGRTDEETPPPEARPWLRELLEAEVAADMLSEAVHRIVRHEWALERRRALAGVVRALQRWVDDGSDAARGEVLRLLAEAMAVSGDEPAREDAALLARRARVWWRVERAVTLLLAARPWTTFPEIPAGGHRVSMSSFRAGGGGTAGVTGLWPNLRVAVQATVAVALAIVVGRAISTARWYWAVLASFVVFIRATTLAETLSRAWQRFFGTVLGVTAGLAIAELLRHHKGIATVIALLAVFVSYAMLRISYSVMILFITIALALLYELLGRPVPGLMELRLAETAAGAGIGVLAAALVFPMHSMARLRRLVAEVLREAAPVITRATTPGVEPCRDDALHDLIRRVDQALAEVRNAVRPLWAPQLPREPTRLTRYGRTAAALAYATRRLLTEMPVVEAADAGALSRVGEALAANCRAAAEALESDRPPALAPVEPLLDELMRAARGARPAIGSVAMLCGDLDAIVRQLVADAGLGPAPRERPEPAWAVATGASPERGRALGGGVGGAR